MMSYKRFNQKKKREINGPSAAVLKYDLDNGAPQVVASGKGLTAERIIALAKQNGIPVQEDSQLVSNLIDLDLGDNVPPQLYSVIAEVLLMLEEFELEDY
jgi:flagellar biosynthesis protein